MFICWVRFVVTTATTMKISVFGIWSHIVWWKCTGNSASPAAPIIRVNQGGNDDDDIGSVIL
jgi:hypothetical protein